MVVGGEPEQRIAEDYLRILRFFRFDAWYGRGAPNAAGLAACAALAQGVRALSAERVSKELLKLLAAPDPLPSVQAMDRAGVLEQLPLEADVARLARLRGIEDALGLAADAGRRLAALSVGDPVRRAADLRLPNAMRDRLQAAAGTLGATEASSPQAIRRALYRLGAVPVVDRLLLSGDAAQAPALRPALELAASWTPPPFPLDGAQIKAAGVRQGPDIGRVRRAVEDWWIAADFPDDPAALEAALRTAAEPFSRLS